MCMSLINRQLYSIKDQEELLIVVSGRLYNIWKIHRRIRERLLYLTSKVRVTVKLFLLNRGRHLMLLINV